MENIDSTFDVLLIHNYQTKKQPIATLLNRIPDGTFEVHEENCLKNGLLFLQRSSPDVVLLNIESEDDNLETIRQIEKHCCRNKIAIVAIVEELDSTFTDIKADKYLIRKEISQESLEKTIVSIAQRQQYAQRLQKVKEENYELNSQLIKTKSLFESIVGGTSNLIWSIDLQGNYTFLNQAWLSFTGQTLATALKEDWRSRIHPEDLAQFNRVYQNALAKQQGFQIEYRLKRFDGKYRTVVNTAVRQEDSQKKFIGFLCSCVDITRHKAIEQQLIQQSHTDRILTKIAQNIYSSLNINLILQAATDEIVQFLAADRVFITKVHDCYELSLLFESKSATSSSCELFDLKKLPVKELKDNFNLLSSKAIVALGNTSEGTVINNGCGDCTLTPYSLLLVPILCDRQLWGLICIDYSLSQKYRQQLEVEFLEQVTIQLGIAIRQWLLYQKLKLANRELSQQASVDGLTGIANRRQFDRYIALEWKRCAREKHPLSLIICDLDYFKLYNDAYGHQAGDLCLMAVAQAMVKVTKRPADLVARYGGEEFAIILPNTNIWGAKYIAEQVRFQIEALKIAHVDSTINDYVTLSLGVACCIPDRHLKLATTIEAADKGLYQAKKMGRNRVCIFEIDKLTNHSTQGQDI